MNVASEDARCCGTCNGEIHSLCGGRKTGIWKLCQAKEGALSICPVNETIKRLTDGTWKEQVSFAEDPADAWIQQAVSGSGQEPHACMKYTILEGNDYEKIECADPATTNRENVRGHQQSGAGDPDTDLPPVASAGVHRRRLNRHRLILRRLCAEKQIRPFQRPQFQQFLLHLTTACK